MVVTDVKLRLTDGGSMKATASITLDNELVINELRIVEGSRGLFVAMPSRRCSDGKYRDYAFSLSTELRDEISASVMEEYGSLMKAERRG